MALGFFPRLLGLMAAGAVFSWSAMLVGQDLPQSMRLKHDGLIRAADTLLQEINHYTNQLFRLETQAHELANRLQSEREIASTSFAAMQRLSMSPRPTALIDPNRALDYTRAQSLLAHLRPDLLLSETGTVQALEQLRALQERRATTFEALSKAEKRYDVLSAEIHKLAETNSLGGRGSSQAETTYLTDDDQHLIVDAALPGSALFRRALPKHLFERPEDLRNYEQGTHRLRLPLERGRIKSSYNHAKTSLQFRHGVLLNTERLPADVVAPFDAQVVFSQPLDGYGHTIILRHSAELVSILSGVDKVDVIVGQWVYEGDRIGHMIAERRALFWQLRYKKLLVDPIGRL